MAASLQSKPRLTYGSDDGAGSDLVSGPLPARDSRDVDCDDFEVRVGTDVQSIAEVAQSIAHFGDRYVRRLYTEHEVECCGGARVESAPGLAARFASKEAMIKLLRVKDNDPGWKSIEVRRRPGGWCEISLGESARRLADEAGVTHLSMSMSHGAGVATATVVGLCQAGAGA